MSAASWLYDYSPGFVRRWLDQRAWDRDVEEQYEAHLERTQSSIAASLDRGKAQREDNEAILRHEQRVAWREIESEQRNAPTRGSVADADWFRVYDDLEAGGE